MVLRDYPLGIGIPSFRVVPESCSVFRGDGFPNLVPRFKAACTHRVLPGSEAETRRVRSGSETSFRGNHFRGRHVFRDRVLVRNFSPCCTLPRYMELVVRQFAYVQRSLLVQVSLQANAPPFVPPVGFEPVCCVVKVWPVVNWAGGPFSAHATEKE